MVAGSGHLKDHENLKCKQDEKVMVWADLKVDLPLTFGLAFVTTLPLIYF